MSEKDECCTIHGGLYAETPIGQAARAIQGHCASLIALGPSHDRSVENDLFRAVEDLRIALKYREPWR